MIVANDIEDLIGNTPMIRINKMTGPDSAEILAKLEWYNIGGSIKDRMALFLIRKTEEDGMLVKGKRILEATSGNTGIALSMLAALKGYEITVVMSESASVERRKLIRAFGAELIFSPAEKGTGGARELKKKLLAEHPEKYVDIDQFRDPANVRAHYETTGNEILEQTGWMLDAVVVGVGTGGTGVGTSMALKDYDPNIRVVGVVPAMGTSIQGLRNPKEQNPSQLFESKYFDAVIELSKKEEAETLEVAKMLARKEGLLVGMSSAAVMYVALKEAKKLGKGRRVVAIFPDNADKYLSTGYLE